MGCGQSKINLYPRRNKHGGGKANGAKKTGAGEKEADEEEGGAGAGAAAGDVADDDADKGKHLLPLVSHAAVIEVSASQQDFFKMLDDKIEKGRDYDSSSESEIRSERDRRVRLVREWQSKSQSSTQSQPSPPTPARRRNAPRAAAPLASPPPRRCRSAQGQSGPQEPPAAVNGRDHHSPVRRPQSAGSGWKANPKVSPYCQPVTKNGAAELGEAGADAADPGREASQITYNPTFQTHSPAHAPLKPSPVAPQQPYIAQIVTYPTVSPAPPNSYISPPETYREPAADPAEYAVIPQPVYYIHGATPDRALTQKQQTALHLQHYVAMKQAQQSMFGYATHAPPYEATEESYGAAVAYYAGYRAPAPRPRSAPPPLARPLAAMSPLLNQVSVFAHMAPAMQPYGPFPPGPFPPTEAQYYQHAQLMQNAYRPGSAGTLTRYAHKERAGEAGAAGANECQSVNFVRQKAVGQIMSLGGQDLGVYRSAGEGPGAAPAGEAAPEGAEVLDKTKNGNGGAVKTRTHKLRHNSKSVDSKKE